VAKTPTKEPIKATAVVGAPKPARKAAAIVAPKAARKATAVLEAPKPARKATAVLEALKPAAKAPRAKSKAASQSSGERGKRIGAALESLLAKGRDEGFITHDQILQAMPQPEMHPGEIEELYAAAEESGVEVLDAAHNPTLIAEAGLDAAEAAGVIKRVGM
jgi:hypothetical protein